MYEAENLLRFGRRMRELRLASGLTLVRLAALALSSKSHIQEFETGKSMPNPTTLALIDRALNANGELIALATEVLSANDRAEGAMAGGDLRTQLHAFLAQPQQQASGSLMASIDHVRRSVDRTIATVGTITADQVDVLFETTSSYARECLVVPPLEMLCRLVLAASDVQDHITACQDPPIMQRLYGIAARLSSLVADEMMVLGNAYQSRAWHSTARVAADKTTDHALRADVRTLAALLPLYYGDAREVVTLTRQAQGIAGDAASLTTAVAPMYESLALAQLSAVSESEAALNTARVGVANLKPQHRIESIFGLPERRWRFYEGKILSFLGRTEEAWEVHDKALALYPDDVVGDPALIQFDRSVSLIRGNQVAAGCTLAEHTLVSLPDDHRTSIFVRAARRTLSVVPRDQQAKPEVQRYREAIRSCHAISA